jgi:hypothetical protein
MKVINVRNLKEISLYRKAGNDPPGKAKIHKEL